jgi:hypothetical protein
MNMGVSKPHEHHIRQTRFSDAHLWFFSGLRLLMVNVRVKNATFNVTKTVSCRKSVTTNVKYSCKYKKRLRRGLYG